MEKKLQKILNTTFIIITFIVFAYFIVGECLLPADRPTGNDTCRTFHGKWERVLADGERQPVKVPGKCRADRNELVTVETRLPGRIGHNKYLCFRSAKQDMNFYIDGKLRQTYSTKDTRLFGRMSAVAYIFLEIREEDAGKLLQVETKTDSAYSGIVYTVYYGTPLGVWNHFFKQFGLELIVAFVTLILSIVAIVGSMSLRFYYHRKVPLEYLGWGILIAAVWLITNSTFRQLLFPNISIVNDMTFLMIMLLSLPYLLYMDEIQKGRYRKGYHTLEIIVTINFIVYSTLHITRCRDFTDTIGYVSFFCIVSILWLILTILVDLFRKQAGDYLFVAIGMFGVCVAAFVQIIIYFQRVNLFNGVILAVGLIFLLVFSTINTIREIVEMDREKQQALQASEYKGRFLAQMSHEIRTPIHAVLGMDEMILRESSEEPIRRYAMDIQNAGQTLLSLINDILDISKIESGKLEILPVDYDFSSLIHDVVNMMEMKAEDKGLAFYLSVEPDIPSRLYGDDVRIRQILVNLLNNAIKYTETGSVTFRVTAELQENAADIHFEVKDTGIGIKESDMEKLFREFERIEESRNRQIEGTGLGMNIALQLLDMMESRLEVESTYGEGSVFSFTLRQQIMSSEPVGNLEQRIRKQSERNENYQVLFTAPNARILIVDDNAVNRRVLSNLLKETQIQIDEAASGEQCLEMIMDTGYDLIFMDHMMPEMDGIETLHRIRAMETHSNTATPVIALTANAVTGAREMYLEEGFENFLSKPVNPQKMEKMILEYLPEDKVCFEEASETVSEPAASARQEETEKFPSIDGIDWEYASLHCPNYDILLDTVHQFYQMIGPEAEKLREFYDRLAAPVLEGEERSSDLTGYRIQVHSMKSSAAMIGAVPLSGIARMLEYAARDEKTKEILSVTPSFLEEWMAMKERLGEFAGDVEPEEQVELDPELYLQLLGLLPEAMEQMDVDMADGIIEQLKQYRLPDPSAQDILEKLCQAVAHLEDRQVRELCSKLEQTIGK